MPIIDINARFGAYPARHRTTQPDQLAEEAQALSVDFSVVCSTTGIYYNDADGNNETLAAVAKLPQRLIAAATINPAAAVDPGAMVAEIAAKAFRLVRFFPSTQGWPIEFAPFTQALRVLGEKGLPAMITCDRLGDATQIARLVSHIAPGLPVVLEGPTADTVAEAVAAMRECPTLLLETHALVSPDILPRVRDAIGAERIVFGSGASALSLGAALSYINGSTLSEAEKALVLGNNAKAKLAL